MKNKKKKGFTLIELVIVLAVLAIISLIAIPNFTKVRNDSLQKADLRTAEQIEKITLMAIANEDIKLTGAKQIFNLAFDDGNKNFIGYTKTPQTRTLSGEDDNDDTEQSTLETSTPYAQMLSEVKKPQYEPSKNTHYIVEVGITGKVAVEYGTASGSGDLLSGTKE